MINKENLEGALGRDVDVICTFEETKVEGKISLDKEMELKRHYQKQFGDDVDIIIVEEVEDRLKYAVCRKILSDWEYPVVLH